MTNDSLARGRNRAHPHVVIGDDACSTARLVRAGWCMPTTPPGAGPDLHRGLHPRRVLPCTQYPHPGVGDGAAARRPCAKTHGGSSGVPSGDTTRTSWCSADSGATGAIDRLIRVLELRDPPQRPVRVRRSLRTPLKRTAVARVVAESCRSARTPTAGRPRALAVELGVTPRPAEDRQFSAASNVTGIVTDVERWRSPAPPRRAVVLGLRGGGPLCRDRHEPSPTRGHLADKDAVFVSPHKFVGGPGTRACWSPSARCCETAVPSVPGRRHGPVRQPDQAHLQPGAVGARGGGHPGDRRVDPRRARVRAEGASAPTRSAAGSGTSVAARSRRGRESKHRDPRQPERRAAGDRLVGVRHAAGCCTQLHRRAAQRPVRDPGPQRLLLRRPLSPPDLRHRRGWSSRMDRRRRGHLGAKIAFVRVNFAYFISDRRSRTSSRRAPPCQRGVEAAAALPLRPASGLWW